MTKIATLDADGINTLIFEECSGMVDVEIVYYGVSMSVSINRGQVEFLHKRLGEWLNDQTNLN